LHGLCDTGPGVAVGHRFVQHTTDPVRGVELGNWWEPPNEVVVRIARAECIVSGDGRFRAVGVP
jgi:hypothetical protein